MVPTYFIPVSVLPLTANNKVDRNKLRRLYDSFSINELHNLIAQRASAEGLNTFEENVAHTLSRSLKMEVGSISPNSSLFELGLDSISVIRFVRVLHQSGFKGASISLVMNSRFKMTD
jgi:aryl carrier-like protein